MFVPDRILGATACLAGIFLLTLGSSEAGSRKSDSKIKVTAEPGKADASGKQTVRLTIAVAEGWHIYANPVGNEALASNATTVTAQAGKKMIEVKADYPAGKKAVLFGEKMSVYEGTVVIPVHLTRDTAEPVILVLGVSACDAKQCLAYGEVRITVP
jgi:DsbC/DsbD-like thiol-disulfide interchange protein